MAMMNVMGDSEAAEYYALGDGALPRSLTTLAMAKLPRMMKVLLSRKRSSMTEMITKASPIATRPSTKPSAMARCQAKKLSNLTMAKLPKMKTSMKVMAMSL